MTGGLMEAGGRRESPCWRGSLGRCHTRMHAPWVSVCVSARQPVFDAAVEHPHINTTQRL